MRCVSHFPGLLWTNRSLAGEVRSAWDRSATPDYSLQADDDNPNSWGHKMADSRVGNLHRCNRGLVVRRSTPRPSPVPLRRTQPHPERTGPPPQPGRARPPQACRFPGTVGDDGTAEGGERSGTAGGREKADRDGAVDHIRYCDYASTAVGANGIPPLRALSTWARLLSSQAAASQPRFLRGSVFCLGQLLGGWNAWGLSQQPSLAHFLERRCGSTGSGIHRRGRILRGGIPLHSGSFPFLRRSDPIDSGF